ncbi:hypothetical protein ABH926_002914 [Catenulispora sp. GP43]|uniref:hypothetical protein n=1 Tax=Catenulispora sp. GP43 TaxID=3156263 RepID=UPI0035138EEC
MNEDFQRLRTRLADLADAPAPASPFDPVRTAAGGRRRVLAHRTSAVGGTGALAVAAVFGIVAAFGPGGTPPPATPVAASGIGTDPLAKDVDFGWLPAALPNVSYAAIGIGAGNDVVAQGDKTPDGAPRLDLQMMQGKGPGTVAATQRLIPVKLNDGRQAYWVTQSSGGGLLGDFQLRFPAKDDRWVQIAWSVNWGSPASTNKIAGLPPDAKKWTDSPTAPTSPPVSAQWQEWLLRIATEVTDVPDTVPMPLRVSGLPAYFRPDRTFLWRPGGFGAGAPGTFSVMLVFDWGGANVSIEIGQHGTLTDTKAVKGIECKTAAGLDACVDSSGSVWEYEEVGGAKGLLDRITLLGTDEKQWTTDVFVP